MKQVNKNPKIKVTIESPYRQDAAFCDLCDSLNGVAEKYKLNYYECFGILEALKIALLDGKQEREQQGL